MRIRPLGRSGLSVSALALGTMNFGSDMAGAPVDEATARRLVGMALDAGVTLFDTADVYGGGRAERILGRALGPHRARVLIATKVLGPMDDADTGGLSAARIEARLDDSLRRLGTDCVDLYMPHAPDQRTPLEETLMALDRAARKGKVRVVGFSNYSASEWGQALDLAADRGWLRPEFDQVQLSLAHWEETELTALCAARATSILAWSPLGGGFLSGKYLVSGRARGRRDLPGGNFPQLDEARLTGAVARLRAAAARSGISPAQYSLAWVLSRPGVAAAICGVRTPEQWAELLSAADRPSQARLTHGGPWDG